MSKDLRIEEHKREQAKRQRKNIKMRSMDVVQLVLKLQSSY